MSRSIRLEIIATLTLLAAATWMIYYVGADLSLSSCFYTQGGWPIGELFPWKALYHLDRLPSFILAICGLIAFLIAFRRSDMRHWRRSGAFLVLLLVLGPGLLVNAVFKDHWGRPRPREIVQFGGNREFLHPWQIGISRKGRSFPSGHSAAAFYMTAPYFIYRRNRKQLALIWLSGGLIFGIFMSVARIAQGGHFLSDTLWSWGMVHLCAILLAALLKPDSVPDNP